MRRNRISIFAVTVATLALLVSILMPHHHHGYTVCVDSVSECLHDEQIPDHKHTDENGDGSDSYCVCTITDYASPAIQKSFNAQVLDTMLLQEPQYLFCKVFGRKVVYYNVDIPLCELLNCSEFSLRAPPFSII